jgi:hypothetical protein
MSERFDYGKEISNPTFLSGDSEPERAIRSEIWVTRTLADYERWEGEFMFDENNKEAKDELKKIKNSINESKDNNNYVKRLYEELSKRESWNLV